MWWNQWNRDIYHEEKLLKLCLNWPMLKWIFRKILYVLYIILFFDKMVKLICITNSSYVTGKNNLFIYSLPQSVKFTNKSKLGLISIAVYNSTFNVSASRGNNTLTFIFNAQTPVTYTWTIPDGYYSASALNAWLQSQIICQ